MKDNVTEYLDKRADLETRPLVAGTLEGIEQVVVIPVLAERNCVFKALASLGRNPQPDLDKTLVICVVNNRKEPYAARAEIEDNKETLTLLERLVQGGTASVPAELEPASIRLGYIDAASPGNELPRKGGVGLARKIGLDWGVAVLRDAPSEPPRLLFSLDADTLAAPNYLGAVRTFFAEQSAWAAVVAYAHRLDGPGDEAAAIQCYELFLRYHVMGLSYARSPYAFPSIGSTMVCRVEAYAAVAGMNTRQGGEDFYFLQQLAKTGGVSRIFSTTVFPSSRPSRRAPFGTGMRVQRFLDGAHDEYRLYDPRSYRILKEWFALVAASLDRDASFLRAGAQAIAPQLVDFLDINRFSSVWPRLRRNSSGPDALHAQFHRWFDGFKTLKLLHFLRDNGFPQQDMFPAIKQLLAMAESPKPPVNWRTIREDRAAQKALLEHLRWYAERHPPPWPVFEPATRGKKHR
ncbi:MAG TPA: hypothetical protein HPP83_13075 [Candidatus Hydrogenedentes bacterium]|nr:hypothetical protein [Candidatus Hydrogenedentota bacterium]